MTKSDVNYIIHSFDLF